MRPGRRPTAGLVSVILMKNAPVMVAVIVAVGGIVLGILCALTIRAWLLRDVSPDQAVLQNAKRLPDKRVLASVQSQTNKVMPAEAKLPPDTQIAEDAALPTDQPEASLCKLNLRRMFAAVNAYQKDHKDLPDWLSDLVPNYLAETNILICPAARRTSVSTYPGLEDPRITTSYTYDFCAREVPTTVWGGAPVTMRDWKNRQRKIFGDALPLIRCLHHDPVLNISCDGEVFESTVTWESDERFRQLSEGREERPM